MADEIKQLIDMVAGLKITVDEGFKAVDKRFEEVDKRFDEVDKRFTAVDKRFDTVEVAIKELNDNQLKIMNTVKLFEHDIKNNKKHIEKLEERKSYL